MTTGKIIALTRKTFVGKVMSLLFKMLSAAAAKSLKSCPTLCDPIDGSPPGSRPWDSPGKNTGVGSMTNLDSILKNRDITLTTNVHLVKAIVFSVVMYGCENWTIKKAECRRIDSFELWCWKRLLRVT